MYRLIWSDGIGSITPDADKMLEQIRQRSEQDAEGYQRFFKYSEKVFDKGYTDLVDRPFLRFSDMLKVTPDLMKLRAERPFKTVSKYVKDEHLRQAMSFHSLLVGGNPFQTSSIYTLIHFLERQWGVFFPRGGTHALVRALVKLFEELGGEIRLNSPVKQARLVNSGTQHEITDGNGGTQNFDVVVSNADIHHTYDRIYGDNKLAKKRAKKLLKKWIGRCHYLSYTSALTLNTRMLHITPFYSVHDTKDCLMKYSRVLVYQKTSVCISMFQL